MWNCRSISLDNILEKYYLFPPVRHCESVESYVKLNCILAVKLPSDPYHLFSMFIGVSFDHSTVTGSESVPQIRNHVVFSKQFCLYLILEQKYYIICGLYFFFLSALVCVFHAVLLYYVMRNQKSFFSL